MNDRPAQSKIGQWLVIGWVCAVGPVTLAALAILDRRLTAAGRVDLHQLNAAGAVFTIALLSASAVGAVLAVRRPGHPVGWIFLALGADLAVAGVGQSYALAGAVARPGSLPWAAPVAVFADAQFVVWLVLLAAALYLTPTGRTLTRRWHWLLVVTIVSACVWFALKMFGDEPLNEPLQTVAGPWARHFPLPLSVLYLIAVAGSNVGVVLGGVSVIFRVKRSQGVERRQLKWMLVVAIVFPLLVISAFVASITNHPTVLNIAAALFVTIVPVAAGLSVLQYRLYDVDRILSRAAAYVVVSILLGGVFVGIIAVLGSLLGGIDSESRAAGLVASVSTAAMAAPLYRRVQRTLDRRFNRRQYNALNMVRDFIRDPTPQAGVEELFRSATGDPTLRIAYRVNYSTRWVSATGHAVPTDGSDLVVSRRHRPVARIHFDATTVERELVESMALEATAELDNVGLRAAVALQLVEVQQSRARIVAAHLSERHRLERNLHDGAQQRLLGMAFEMRAAQLSGDEVRIGATLADAVGQLRTAVEELRDLANGLHPQMLSDGGLAAALEDLASRTTVPIHVHATNDRFEPDVEAALWFIACEAITNAVKHADSSWIEVSVERLGDSVRLAVDDDGVGGADASGTGLRGLADRAEAGGGRLTVTGRAQRGTTITAELPCAS